MTVCRSRWLHTHSQFWLNYLKNIMWRSESRARFNPKLKVRKSLKRSLVDEPLITFLFKTWSKDVRNVKVRVTWLQTPDESQSLFLSSSFISVSHIITHTHTHSHKTRYLFSHKIFFDAFLCRFDCEYWIRQLLEDPVLRIRGVPALSEE